jgi:hypothetical protein
VTHFCLGRRALSTGTARGRNREPGASLLTM